MGMGYITLGVLGLTLLILLSGFFCGIIRGFKRSVLRSIIIIAGIVAILLLKGTLVGIIKDIEISGKTIGVTITEAIDDAFSGEDMEAFASVADQVKLMVDGILGAIVYIVAYVVLRLITWLIIYPICKIFVKKSPKGCKKRWLGCLVSVVTSVIICITLIGPISGLVYNISSILEPVMEISATLKDSESTDSSEDELNDTLKTLEIIGLTGEKAYSKSTAGKIYRTASGWYYKIVSSATNENGDSIDLDTQLGAIAGVTKTAGAFVKVKDLPIEDLFSGKLNVEDQAKAKIDLINIGKEIDLAMGSMNSAQKKEVGNMLGNVLQGVVNGATGTEGGSEDSKEISDSLSKALENIDLDDVAFEQEFTAIADIADIANSDGTENEDELIERVVNDIAESKIILEFASVIVEDETKGLVDGIDQDQKTKIENQINQIDNQAKKDKIMELFFGKTK